MMFSDRITKYRKLPNIYTGSFFPIADMAERIIVLWHCLATFSAIQSNISRMIPDIPEEVALFQDRQRYLARQELMTPTAEDIAEEKQDANEKK